MKDNKTDLWQQASPSTKYNLPPTCPHCGGHLHIKDLYVGIFPYIHADFTLVCVDNAEHKFNFCFPYNKVMVEGFQILDTNDHLRFRTERKCPWHLETLLPYRYYGNLVFKDDTRKMQLRCPICFYSERVVFK
jgi:hypothetical protein